MRACETCGKPEVDESGLPNYFWCEEYPKIFCSPKCYGAFLKKEGWTKAMETDDLIKQLLEFLDVKMDVAAEKGNHTEGYNQTETAIHHAFCGGMICGYGEVREKLWQLQAESEEAVRIEVKP